ncbi:14507_t:CDS:1, partial [Gigaspora rosea]
SEETEILVDEIVVRFLILNKYLFNTSDRYARIFALSHVNIILIKIFLLDDVSNATLSSYLFIFLQSIVQNDYFNNYDNSKSETI